MRIGVTLLSIQLCIALCVIPDAGIKGSVCMAAMAFYPMQCNARKVARMDFKAE